MTIQNTMDEILFEDDENFNQMINGLQVFQLNDVQLFEQSEEAMANAILLLMMPTSSTIH